ncbi:MAG: hypothetical protein U0228_31095 [Myxococcaceae bacterium]
MTALLALVLAQALSPLSPDQPGSWAEPARAPFIDPSARALLGGINAITFDGLPPASTVFDIDGVRWLAPAHALFGPTALHPAWTEGVTLSRPVDTALDGRFLGRKVSLFNRTTTPGTHSALRIDLLKVGYFFEHGFDDGSVFQAAVDAYGTPALAGAFIKGSVWLGDYQLRWAQKLGRGELRVLALGTLDALALSVSGIPLAARLQNHQLDVRWKSDGVEISVGAHRSTIGLTLAGAAVTNAIDGAEDAVNARAVVGGSKLRGGADVEVRRLSLFRQTHLTELDQQSSTLRELGTAMVAGAFLEARVEEGEWDTTFSVRADAWVPAGQSQATFTADPRVITRRAWTSVDLELSAGLLHQAPTWLVTVPVLESVALRHGVQELARVDATVTVRPTERSSISLHGFGGGLIRAIEFSPFDENFLQLVNQVDEVVAQRATSGWLAGGELRARTSGLAGTTRWWGELSYGFQQSWRLATFHRYGVDGLPKSDAQAWVPWQFQQAHLGRVRAGLEFDGDWKLSAMITVTSGAPLVGGLFAQEQQPGVDSLTHSPRWVPKDRDASGFAPPFVRGDLRASKTWHPGDAEVELFLDVANLSLAQPTGTSYGVVPATLAQQASGDILLTYKDARSPLPPIPMLGVDVRW